MSRQIWQGGGMAVLWLAIFVVQLSLTLTLAEEPPVPDDCKPSPFEDGLELECTLSAINSADEKTNFSVVPAEHTLSLTGNNKQAWPRGFVYIFLLLLFQSNAVILHWVSLKRMVLEVWNTWENWPWMGVTSGKITKPLKSNLNDSYILFTFAGNFRQGHSGDSPN